MPRVPEASIDPGKNISAGNASSVPFMPLLFLFTRQEQSSTCSRTGLGGGLSHVLAVLSWACSLSTPNLIFLVWKMSTLTLNTEILDTEELAN